MSKKIIGGAIAIAVLISAGLFVSVNAQDPEKQDKEIAWFDMEHCGICKNLAAQKANLHKIKWEMYMLDHGSVTVSVVPEELKEGMAKAEKGIEKTVAEMMNGKQVDLCGYCQNYGGLMAMGAKFKTLKTVGGDLNIITASDPEVIEKIHEFAKHAKTAHDKMIAESKAQSKSK